MKYEGLRYLFKVLNSDMACNDSSDKLDKLLNFQSTKELEALSKILLAADDSYRVHELQIKIALEMEKRVKIVKGNSDGRNNP